MPITLLSVISAEVTGFFSGIVDGVKDFLGIHSPSKVFAGMGENMALGLGDGFTDEMKAVTKQINKAVPTSIDMAGSYGMSGRGAGGVVVNVPVMLDGRIISSTNSRIQYGQNRTRSRALGVT